jgi:hypothetical protein
MMISLCVVLCGPKRYTKYRINPNIQKKDFSVYVCANKVNETFSPML